MSLVATHDYATIGYYNTSLYNSLDRMPQASTAPTSIEELKTLDETDVDYITSIYRNNHPDFFLGGWVIQATINILQEFTMNHMPKVESNNKEIEKFALTFLNKNISKIFQTTKELGLFGKTHVFVNGFGNVPKLRVLNKKNIVRIGYENYEDPEDITYVRIRDIYSKPINQDEEEQQDNPNINNYGREQTIVDKIYWKELNKEYSQYTIDIADGKMEKYNKTPEQWNYYIKVIKKQSSGWIEIIPKKENFYKVIPVVEFEQNKLSSDTSGYGDCSGILRIASIYHQLLEKMVNADLYNNNPQLKFTGIKNSPIEFAKIMYGDASLNSGDTVDIYGLMDTFGTYFLEGNSDVSYLTVPNNIDQSMKIIDLLFKIIIRTTGVPEWAFGAEMSSTWANVKQQSVLLYQKVKSKRMDINDSLIELIEKAYKTYKIGNELKDTEINVVWSEVLEMNSEEVLQLINTLHPKGLIQDKTALSLTKTVTDPELEIEETRKETEWKKDEALKRQIKEMVEVSKNSPKETNVQGQINKIKQNKKLEPGEDGNDKMKSNKEKNQDMEDDVDE